MMPSTSTHHATARRAARGKSTSPSGRGPATNAFALLKADHDEVSELFKKASSNRISDEKKQSLVEEICQALKVHAEIEESIFYPAAKEVLGEEDDMLGEAEVEHGSIKRLIAALEESAPDDKLYCAN